MLHTANGPARAAKPRPASTVGPLVSPSLLSSFAVSQMMPAPNASETAFPTKNTQNLLAPTA